MATVITDPPVHIPQETGAKEETPGLNPPPEKSPVPEAPRRLLKQYEGFLIPGLVLFALGNALAYALPNLPLAQPLVGGCFILVFAGLILAAIGREETRSTIRVSLWSILLIAGCLHYSLRHFTPGLDDVSHLAPLNQARAEGVLIAYSSPTRAVVSVRKINNQPVSGQLLAYLPATSQIPDGTRVMIEGDLKRPFESSVPGAFNQARWLESQHITAVLKRPGRIIAFQSDNSPRFVLQRFTNDLKARVSATFAKALPSPQAEVFGGLVLGDKAIPVDAETKSAFVQTGLIHVLAASGMNVAIIAGAVLWLLILLKVPFRKRLGLAMLAVAFYSLLTGMPPSIQRAAAMLEIALALKMLNRELSPVFLLCLATNLLLLMNPENMASIGFQFSVLTTFGLVTMVPPLQDALGYYITRALAGTLLVPLIAQLWIWPLSVEYFNQFPIHSLPMNIVAMLLVAPLTVLGFTAGMLSLIMPPLAGALCWLSQAFLNPLLWLVHWGQDQGWAQWQLPSPAPWLVFALYVELFVLLALIYRLKTWSLTRRMLLGLLPISLMLGGLTLAQAATESVIDLLPLSFRHEGYLIHPAGTASTVAVIPDDLTFFEGRAMADYLRHRQITRLDALVLLPGESDESAGLKPVLDQADVLKFYAPQNFKTDLPVQSVELPAQGGRLQVGALMLEGKPEALTLLDANHCLLAVSDRYHAGTRCGIQAVRDSGATRFYAKIPLSAGRYYRLQWHQGRLSLYDEQSRESTP